MQLPLWKEAQLWQSFLQRNLPPGLLRRVQLTAKQDQDMPLWEDSLGGGTEKLFRPDPNLFAKMQEAPPLWEALL